MAGEGDAEEVEALPLVPVHPANTPSRVGDRWGLLRHLDDQPATRRCIAATGACRTTSKRGQRVQVGPVDRRDEDRGRYRRRRDRRAARCRLDQAGRSIQTVTSPNPGVGRRTAAEAPAPGSAARAPLMGRSPAVTPLPEQRAGEFPGDLLLQLHDRVSASPSGRGGPGDVDGDRDHLVDALDRSRSC